MANFIFLADDDMDDQGLFMDALHQIDPDIRLITAINGSDALKKLKAGKEFPDLIFLDLNMPLMNGMQCLQELKSNDTLKHIPVIIYSTSSYKKDIDTALEAGATNYLVKPFSFSELCDSLRNIIKVDYRK